MPKTTRNDDWCYGVFSNAVIAVKGIPRDNNDRRIVGLAIDRMFDDYEMTQEVAHERVKLTDQDFRAGGFFIWGNCLWQCGYRKLAINHFSSALRIKPRLWRIYDQRGRTNIELGNYVEAIDDFVAGIKCASKQNRSAMRRLQYGIKMAREKANSSPRSS